MKKKPLIILIAGAVAAALFFTLSAAASGPSSLAATSTRWPTVTRHPSDTRWPTATRRMTSTRGPSATRTPTKTRSPSKTSRVTSTRWPTKPPTATHTRWPSRTPSPTRTRYLSPTRTPTLPAGWQEYQNTIAGFKFFYPGDAAITYEEPNHVQIYMSITPGTNLVSKYLEQVVSQYDGACNSAFGGTTIGMETINGYAFLHEEGRDQGAGQIHEWVSYSTVQGTSCISFNFILHSGNPDNYDPPVPLFDKAAESAVFMQIMNTFSMLPATATPTNSPTSSASLGPYGVVFVKSNDVLNIRSGAGTGFPIVGMFSFEEAGVYRTGPSTLAGGATWVQVQNPTGGTGWVNSYYLTEVVAGTTFCSDSRIASLIAQLRQAVNASNGTLFASLVSPVRGVDVRLWHYHAPVHYTQAQAAGVFTSATQQNWGAGPSGIDTIGTFAAVIQPKLADLLNASYESYCNDPKAASMFYQPWPFEYTNFNYYSLFKPGTPGIDLDYRQWMIGVDYVNGQPYLVSFIHIIWEP